MELLEEMMRDLDEVPADADLGSVAGLAKQAELLEAEIRDLDLILKNRKADLQKILHEKLPAALAEQGLSSITLENGVQIKVVPYYSASLTEERRADALAWLRSHGFEDLIKHEITVSFGKGEEKIALKVKSAIEEIGAFPTDKETVHPQTLKAWVREQIEAGRNIPMDLFGAQTGQVAKIARPR